MINNDNTKYSLGNIVIYNPKQSGLSEVSLSRGVDSPPSNGGEQLKISAEGNKGVLTGSAANLQRAIDDIQKNVHSSGNGGAVRDDLMRAGTKSGIFSGGSAFILSSLATGTCGVAIAVLAKAKIPAFMAAGCIAGAGMGFWLSVMVAKDVIDAKHPKVMGCIVIALTCLVCSVGAAVACGVVGAAGGEILGISTTAWLAQGASVGVFKGSLVFLEPFAAHLIGGRAIEKADAKIMEMGKLSTSGQTSNSKGGLSLPSDVIKKVSEFRREMMAKTGKDIFIETLPESEKGSIKDFGKKCKIGAEDSEKGSKIVETCKGYYEKGMAEMAEQGFSKADLEKCQRYCEKPVTNVMEYFFDNVFSPPIHEGLKDFVNYTNWNEDEKVGKPNLDAGEKPTNIYFEIESPIKKEGASASLVGRAMLYVAESAGEIPELLSAVGKAGREALKHVSEAFTPGDRESKGVLKAVGKIGWTAIHGTQTVLHRVTFQAFRKRGLVAGLADIAKAGVGYDISKNKRNTSACKVFDEVARLAKAGPANNGFKNAHHAHENLKQMERRYGWGFGLGPETKLALKDARAAVLSNYGPDRSCLELLSCDWYQGDRLNGILKEVENQGHGLGVKEVLLSK
ncbi:MAG: hypothetical protein V4489_00960 [Chlamydiota bacterium]